MGREGEVELRCRPSNSRVNIAHRTEFSSLAAMTRPFALGFLVPGCELPQPGSDLAQQGNTKAEPEELAAGWAFPSPRGGCES